MQPDRSRTRFTCLGEDLDRAPRCPGVYRFFSADETLLYVGKSIDIGTRLNSHFTDAREVGRQQRMMAALHRVDCELTSGDTGAQLIENAAIKAEAPLYNRRQRRGRTLWTQRLVPDADGFLRVVPSDFCPTGPRSEAVYGLFRSRTQIHGSLRKIAREEGLCLRRIGAESGRGPCFQSQIGRCRGACHGGETAGEHNERLQAALDKQRIAAWPFDGPLLLHEARTARLHDRQPARQYHVLSHWTYLGSFARVDQARRCAGAEHTLFFDRDTYHIVLRALRGELCELLDARGRVVASNPFIDQTRNTTPKPRDRKADDPGEPTEPGPGKRPANLQP